MSYTGQCNCGAVRAEISGEPLLSRQCWCRQCQKAAGGGAMHNAMFRAEDVAITGPIAEFAYTAASGATLVHRRCAECGSPIGAQSSARPQFYTLRLGFLNEPHGISPTMVIWVSEKPAWATIDPALEVYETQPAPPPAS